MIGVRVRDDDLFHVAEAETAGGQHSRQLVDRARLQGAGSTTVTGGSTSR
jgi:hypothetical protein